MDTVAFQNYSIATKRYSGEADGKWGRLSDAAALLAMSDGPDTVLSVQDFGLSGTRLSVQPAAIRAFWQVEAAGAGFLAGRPKILPERHIFSKLTMGRFDLSNPTLSAPKWDKTWYPASQDDRYDVILAWCRLLSAAKMPIDAAFGAVSYGAPQILGSNAMICGYKEPFLFAEAMARDEQTQLRAFEAFCTGAGILPYLRKVDRTQASWKPVASRYNGTAYALNHYDLSMLNAFTRFGGI